MADGSVKIDIVADDSDIKKKLDGVEDAAEDAANGLDNLGDSAEEAGKGFGAADVAIGTFISNGISTLISKVGEAVGSIIALADETREYREDMAKLDSAFTTAGHSTETAQKAYDGFYKILGESDRTVEAVNHLAEMTKNEEELAQWSTICAGVTARFGDSLPIEGLTEAANETAKVGQVTGPLADALNWAGISEDEFNKKLEACNSEQERASLITSTLNKEYEAAAAEYNELTASTQAARDATNNMEQAQAALGAAIEPVTTAWTNMKANALQWFVDVGLPALQTGWGWIKDNIPLITTVVAGLTAAWLAFGGAQTLLNAVQTAGIAIQTALNAVMNANPIGLIILAITALVAGFMLLWDNCEGFRNFWKGLWEEIKVILDPVIKWLKEAFAKAWEAIKFVWDLAKPYFEMVWKNITAVFSVAKAWFGGMFKAAWEAIKAIWDNVIGYFQAIWATIKGIFAVVKAVLSGNWGEAWEAIKGIVDTWKAYFARVWDNIKGVFSAVGTWFGDTFKAAWEAIKNIWGNVKEFFSKIWTKIKEAFIPDDMLKIGKDLLMGLWNGINDKVEWLKSKVKGVVDKIKGWFTGKDGFDEHSPSKWAEQVAIYVNEGLAKGFKVSADVPLKEAKNVIDKIRDYMESEQEKSIKDVKAYNAEIAELNKQLVEDKKKENADIEALEKQHADKVAAIRESIKSTIAGKMQEVVDLEKSYKDNVQAIWTELDKSINDVLKNYDDQLASRTESIANSLNLWNEATKNTVTGKELTKNLESQISVLESYNNSIAVLEGKNLSEAFINQLKSLGVNAAGEIEALAKMTDDELNAYVALWEEKNALAKTAAIEELEPLKAETEAKIEELTNAALDKYTELRTEYQTQGALLMTELKQAMIDAGEGGYEEIIAQIDDYMSAGNDLMEGIVAGIVNGSPALVEAVTNAVNNAIAAAEALAEGESKASVIRKYSNFSLSDAMNGGLLTRMNSAVDAENVKMAQGVGVADTGVMEVARAVGMQTAGINSLASVFSNGSNAYVEVPLIIDGREFGRAVVNYGASENARTGKNELAFT